MRIDDLHYTLDVLKEDFKANGKSVSLVGLGEPLLYPHLKEAITLTHDKLPQSLVVLNTNALLLDKHEYLLKALNPDDILVFSINGSNCFAYKKYMNSPLFEQAVHNVNSFLKEYAQDVPNYHKRSTIYLRYLNVPENDVKEFRSLWMPMALLHPKVKISQHPLLHWNATRHNTIRTACPSLWGGIIVDVDGDVYPCCNALAKRNSELLIGNIRQADIVEQYERKLPLLREQHLRKQYSPSCLTCDFWREASWKWKVLNGLSLIARS